MDKNTRTFKKTSIKRTGEVSTVETTDPTVPPQLDPKFGKENLPKEVGGVDGPEPTRFGDWSHNGRCTDF